MDNSPLTDNIKVFQWCGTTLATYNAVEVIVFALQKFKRYDSLYFWSLLVTASGVLILCWGFLDITHQWYLDGSSSLRPFILTTIGWCSMVTGFAVVFYSRLQLIDISETVQLRVKWMIILNFLCSHVPTTITFYGQSQIKSAGWGTAYDITERMNLIAFCLQEVILGVIFLVNIRKVLGDDRPAVVTQTLRINVMVLVLDIVTVAVEYAHLHDYQVVTKCVVYSIKLKCEFYILSLLEDALKPTRNTVSSNEVLAQAMRNAKAAEARMSENTLSDVVRKSISL